MATTARTTGADAHSEELRRRNVASQSNGAAPVPTATQAKEKSKEKVCTPFTSYRSSQKVAAPDTGNQELTVRQTFDIISFLDEYEFIWAPLIFTFFAFFTRMYKIGLSPIVTWDEAQ
jgi:dolichyl-phosphate-mannose-protein mannosyltransferase